jgi:predicted metal-dependent hydrolase
MPETTSIMQLELPWNNAEMLREILEDKSGLRIELTVTDNTQNVLSVRPNGAGGLVKVRLHHMFLAADTRVVNALAHWIRQPKAREAGQVLDGFIRANRHRIRTSDRRPRTIRVRTRGFHFDLKRLYDEVNEQHFQGSIRAHITWGQMPAKRRRRRSIRFGSYSHEFQLIRIHPLLDQEWVPEYFVRYIVFHELLHAHLGISESESGRRQMHTAEFRALEKAYPDYERALAWQNNRRTLARLLK